MKIKLNEEKRNGLAHQRYRQQYWQWNVVGINVLECILLTDNNRNCSMHERRCSGRLAYRPYHSATMNAIAAVNCDRVRSMSLDSGRHRLMRARAAMTAFADAIATVRPGVRSTVGRRWRYRCRSLAVRRSIC